MKHFKAKLKAFGEYARQACNILIAIVIAIYVLSVFFVFGALAGLFRKLADVSEAILDILTGNPNNRSRKK